MSQADWDPYGSDAHLTPVFGRLRHRTLVILRWIAVAGQGVSILFVYYVLGFELPLGFCIGVILASVWANTWLTLSVSPQRFANDWEVAIHLSFDVLQLCMLLALTGGLQNPFIVMLAAPVTISVASLPLRWSGIVAATALIGSAAMYAWNLPLPWIAGESLALPGLYMLGLWSAIFIAVAFIGIYSWRVSQEGKLMAAALAATQSVLSREQRLSALGAMAAAAAHELGTPLATIQLTAKEMLREIDKDNVLHEDAELMVTQAHRCRDILKRLGQEVAPQDERHDRMELVAALEEASAPLRGLGPMVDVRLFKDHQSHERIPVLKRREELLYGIGNFVENAVDFASTRVIVEGGWDEESLWIKVIDDGPGFTSEILSKLGEPYITTRPGTVGQGGLGLGVFIAKTMIEKSGGRVDFDNIGYDDAPGADFQRGAIVTARWPLKRVEADPILR
jgi:two-component system sensor histidine kinase RegB